MRLTEPAFWSKEWETDSRLNRSSLFVLPLTRKPDKLVDSLPYPGPIYLNTYNLNLRPMNSSFEPY